MSMTEYHPCSFGSDNAAATARQAVRTALGDADVSDEDTLMHDAVLIASELVGNAARHANGVTGFMACLDSRAGRIILHVSDAESRTPEAPTGDRRAGEAEHGYGWQLVNELATRVDIALAPAGKTITVHIPLAALKCEETSPAAAHASCCSQGCTADEDATSPVAYEPLVGRLDGSVGTVASEKAS
ncbi:ATP-binding protein [Streptomyces sp. NPDC014891]|uniref:ATP-binding protein n=1 Tax=Streptomyces sp. NPDC014891 TaxID=3364929 RepID=UPI0036FEBD29